MTVLYLFLFFFFGKLRIVIANLGYVVVSLSHTTKLVLNCYVVIQALLALDSKLVYASYLSLNCYVVMQVILVYFAFLNFGFDCYACMLN